MFGRKRKREPDAIEVILGPHATFNGALRCDTSIRIDGAVEGGSIETAANVVITETAHVDCTIQAHTVSIRGFFRGVIEATRVELLQGCQVYGTLNVNTFFMDEGVLLQAEMNIRDQEQRTQASLPRREALAPIPFIEPRRPRPEAPDAPVRGQPSAGQTSMP